MKLKIIIGIAIMIIIACIGAILLYFFTGNVSSKIPDNIIKECNVKEEKYQNRSVFVITPKETNPNGQFIYYLHGGSYVAELSTAHWKFLSKLAQDTKASIIVPDYPLTPQYQYQETFRMVEPLYKVLASTVEKENLIVMGDSAGGGMALSLMEEIGKEEDAKKPSKVILISPWLDVSMKNPKIQEIQEKDKMLNRELLKMAGVAYAGSEEAVKEPLVSPIYGQIENVENLVIYTGTNDILNPDVYVLKEKAKKKRNRYTSRRNSRSST